MKKLFALFVLIFLSGLAGNASAGERVCNLMYAPVCGADGVTYGNRCQAGEVVVAHEGECEVFKQSLDCDIRCLRYDPVCGDDGRTFACGQAEADCKGVIVVREGECGKAVDKKKMLSCGFTDNVKQHRCLMLKEKQLFENYLRVEISSLSPRKPVLGGKFQVTKISWKADRRAIVEFEDGHISLQAETQIRPIRKGKDVVGGQARYFKLNVK
ncbi:MAG: Kazal-type serine protease inhibitor domain-containing protein [Bacillota bacterium]